MRGSRASSSSWDNCRMGMVVAGVTVRPSGSGSEDVSPFTGVTGRLMTALFFLFLRPRALLATLIPTFTLVPSSLSPTASALLSSCGIFLPILGRFLFGGIFCSLLSAAGAGAIA
ncbi:hypothetical protein E2C01_033583 [Portunus trituberculatus]|uniref:Uncharacterized protein n=1 Tax=Portunus trituberculatus TaxID=210409 RepID=A0A5B7F4H1_PORTR|nr:hypothetical protein [Portunus trituberculatus]